jgi:opacity protein-like surface antigen
MHGEGVGFMIWLRTLAVAGAALAASAIGTRAADAPGNFSLPLPPPTQETPLRRVEVFSGWYLRGDLGYRFQRIGTASSGDPAQVPVPDSSKLDNTFMGGLGAGYKWKWFRVDLTGDYGGRSKYAATTAPGTTFDGKVESFTVMANGYVDLGTWAGITPYIGAGIGGANVIFSSYENSTAVAPMPSTAVPVHRWNVAWAAMAGLSYNITRDFLIDLGYRHVEMGDVSGGPNSQLTIKRLSGDEIRLGFRYMLD